MGERKIEEAGEAGENKSQIQNSGAAVGEKHLAVNLQLLLLILLQMLFPDQSPTGFREDGGNGKDRGGNQSQIPNPQRLL